MRDIQINGKTIGAQAPVFLIAEAGVNHNGDLNNAKKLIDIAAKSNVDSIKFQTFITEKLITKFVPKVEYQKITTDDKENFYEMIKKYELSKDEFRILKEYSAKKGIIFLSTPFDETSVEWLEELNVPAYKIGSGDMNNFPLLKLICSKKKPILLSTGIATLNEVKESINFIKSRGIEDIVILQCTTSYPAPYKEINLNVIDTYRKEFPNMIIGFSDHSIGIEASIGAVAKGVKVIEKHFTLDKNMEGPDHKASMDPKELIKWVNAIRKIEIALGSYEKKPSKTELEIAKIARKSIISVKNLKPGDVIQAEDIIIKRPGYGIPPKEYENIIGKKVINSISKDSIIRWEDVE
ncbi:MAG: N-acetylneuraminate synthase [Candidatus Lokiarchaeia archaeon]